MLLPKCIANAESKYSINNASLQCAHGALEDLTDITSQQRFVQHTVQRPIRGVCFEHAQNKCRRMVAFPQR